jgi:hypothetical protein
MKRHPAAHSDPLLALDDAALDATLARTLGPGAEDTAELSRIVLSRIADEAASPARAPLAEVLVAPLPAAGALFGALLLAGAAGYALLPGLMGDEMTVILLIGREH